MKINIRNLLLPFYVAISILLMSAGAQAKTSGYYASIDLYSYDVESNISIENSNGVRSNSSEPNISLIYNPKVSSSDVGFGFEITKTLRLSYFSILDVDLYESSMLGDVYVSAGLFYDRLNYNNYANNTYNISMTSRYGANIGAGYDVTDYLAVYANIGIASNDYEIDSRNFFNQENNGGSNATDNNRAISPIIALGFNLNITEDFLLGFKFSKQNIDLESSSFSTTNGINGYDKINLDTSITTYGLRLSKRF